MFPEFGAWLQQNTHYATKVQYDIVSRVKRANSLIELPTKPDLYYIFQLQQNDTFKAFSCSVRSQIKSAVKLYFEFLES